MFKISKSERKTKIMHMSRMTMSKTSRIMSKIQMPKMIKTIWIKSPIQEQFKKTNMLE